MSRNSYFLNVFSNTDTEPVSITCCGSLTTEPSSFIVVNLYFPPFVFYFTALPLFPFLSFGPTNRPFSFDKTISQITFKRLTKMLSLLWSCLKLIFICKGWKNTMNLRIVVKKESYICNLDICINTYFY